MMHAHFLIRYKSIKGQDQRVHAQRGDCDLGVLYLLQLVLQASSAARFTIPSNRSITATDLGVIDALLHQCSHLFLSGTCSQGINMSGYQGTNVNVLSMQGRTLSNEAFGKWQGWLNRDATVHHSVQGNAGALGQTLTLSLTVGRAKNEMQCRSAPKGVVSQASGQDSLCIWPMFGQNSALTAIYSGSCNNKEL